MRLMKSFLLAAAAILAMPSSAYAATLVVNGSGQLTGATGVQVGGTLFDVTFVEGTCAQLFSGCNENSDFTFNTLEGSNLAAQALLDQVFINAFDTTPGLTFGCTGAPGSCNVFVPRELGGLGFLAANAVNSTSVTDQVNLNAGGSIGFPSEASNDLVFARFSASTSSPGLVPEPSTWAMMLIGFGLIGGAMRSQKRRQKLTVSYT